MLLTRPPVRGALAVAFCALATTAADCPPNGNDAGPDGGTAAAWAEAFDTTEAGSVSGVWGSGPNDVIAVGGDATAGTIFRYDGSDWTKQDIPDVPLLVWVYGWGADDVIAVGTDGGCVRWDGSNWNLCTTGTDQDLWGVFGFASNDVWVVGGDTDGDVPLILHDDGSGFAPVALDEAQNPTGAKSLFKVWGIDGRLWAVGERGLILEYVSGAWTRQPAGALADDKFVSLWGTSADNITAVGGLGNARIARFDGTSWETVAPSGIGGLNAVFMTEAGKALVGGVEGFLATWDLGAEDLAFEEVDTRWDIHALWCDSVSRCWAVGGNFRSPFRGVALTREY
jgi:hypothetical protein